MEDFRTFTSPYAFEMKDGRWVVLPSRYRTEPVEKQPTEVLEDIIVRQLTENRSGSGRVAIPAL